MLAKDREFNALSRFGDKLLRSLSQDEKVVLAQRLSEVNQRWKALQVRNNLTSARPLLAHLSSHSEEWHCTAFALTA